MLLHSSHQVAARARAPASFSTAAVVAARPRQIQCRAGSATVGELLCFIHPIMQTGILCMLVQRFATVRTRLMISYAVAGTQLSLHCGETTLQMPFTPQQGQTLDEALSKLLQTFAEKQAAARPKRYGYTWLDRLAVSASTAQHSDRTEWRGANICCIRIGKGVTRGH